MVQRDGVNVFSETGPLTAIERVILTGFRATGKSVVGKELAAILGFVFIDTDSLLCAQEGMSVADFVARHGWPLFRERESKVLVELAGRKKLVIAVGGGAIEHQDVWKVLRQKSLVVWLQADTETIHRRLRKDVQSPDQRPSLTGKGVEDEVADLLAQREPLYRAGSDFALNTVGQSPEEIARCIVRFLATGETTCGGETVKKRN